MRRLLAAACLLAAGGALRADEARVERMRGEIERLRAELAALERKESGLLGEVARLDADVRLREAESEEAGARLGEIESALAEREAKMKSIGSAQEARRRYLGFRMRELYKAGPRGMVTSALAGVGAGDALRGLRYAVYLGERDTRTLKAWREDRARLAAEVAGFAADRARYAAVRREAGTAAARLEARRDAQAALLQSIRGDRLRHQSALGELEGASREVGKIVREAGREGVPPRLDVRKFRGLLDWPAAGRVAIPFGSAVHPRFKTKVPHPGIDLDAPRGSRFRAVFDGRVVYAANLPGYGLSAIVDHGNGVASVYTHASALLVSPGQEVVRAEVLGLVGQSGPLGGKGLYFEIRENGRPVDPAAWLRPR